MRTFSYARADTVAEAIADLVAAGPEAKILAGGTNLYDLMKLEIERPPTVVDVHRLAELAYVDASDPRELIIGAGARMAAVAEHPAVEREFPAVAQSLRGAATEQLRNMATIGGNLLQRTRCAYFRGGPTFPCNKRNPGSGCGAIGGIDTNLAVLGVSDSCIATYPGDLAVALVAFDTVLDVASPRGMRGFPLAQLYLEPGDNPQREHTLAPDELILRVRVPASSAARFSTYLKIRPRESYAFALASAAVGVVLDEGKVSDCRIALGGVATRPWRASQAERSLVGGPLTVETARRAGQIALEGARAGTTNEFKIELGIRTVAEALRLVGERTNS